MGKGPYSDWQFSEETKKLLEKKWMLYPFKRENVSILVSVTTLKIASVNKMNCQGISLQTHRNHLLQKNRQCERAINYPTTLFLTKTSIGLTTISNTEHCVPRKVVPHIVDVCIDIYVMMSSDLYGTCSPART